MSIGTLDGKIVNIEERKELTEADINSTNLIPKAINEIKLLLDNNKLEETKSGESIKNINNITAAMENAIIDFQNAKRGEKSEKDFILKYRDVINLGIQKLSERIKNKYISKLEEQKRVLDLAYETQIDKRDVSTNTIIENENFVLKARFIDSLINHIKTFNINNTKTFLEAETDFKERFEFIEELIKQYQNTRSKNDFKQFFENIKIDEHDSDNTKRYKKELLEKSREKFAA